MILREVRPADYPAIDTLLQAAFAGRAEADLVRQLRADGDSEIELVAEDGGQIVGHLLFSPVQAQVRALALAPLAVLPDRQREGIGSRLALAGQQLARERGWQAIFVLGDPAYYSRFGYDAELAASFDSPYSGPHLMALPLSPDLALGGGALRHAPAFSSLED